MTVLKALEIFDEENENDISDDIKKRWLSELDLKIVGELNKNRDGLSKVGYTVEENDATELNAPEEFSEIYIIYLKMKMNYMLCEIERYNNSASLFNRLFYEMANYISRNFKMSIKNSVKVELNNA